MPVLLERRFSIAVKGAASNFQEEDTKQSNEHINLRNSKAKGSEGTESHN